MSLQKTLSQKIAIIENRISKDQAELAAYKLVLSAEALPAEEVKASAIPANPVTPISTSATPVKRRGRPAAVKTVEAKAEVNGVAGPVAAAPVKPGRKPKAAKPQTAKRELSPEARQRIADGQKKRWAAKKRADKKAAKAAADPKETAEQFDAEMNQLPVNGAAHEAA